MKKIVISGFIGSILLVGCGSNSSAEREASAPVNDKKLPLDEISQMLATNEMNPKCKFMDFSETTGVDGKKLSFKFTYDQQPEKILSLSEGPATTSSWSVGRGPVALGYWKLSYFATNDQSQTNLKSVDMAVNESDKKFQKLELTPAGESSSTDCSAN